MTNRIEKAKERAAGLEEAVRRRIELDEIRIEANALRYIAPYLERKGYKSVLIAADASTFEAAGGAVQAAAAKAGIAAETALIRPNPQSDIIADEQSLIQLILAIQKHRAEAVLAVGGGTLHDIARYCAYTAGIPFVSVPTAPSVDGFNSKGAPIIVRGEKKTIPAIGPDAIFADLDVLVRAPGSLIAAGFGDMLGKFTSLFDWRFGQAAAGEPYLDVSAQITRDALLQCVNNAERIAARKEEGVYLLMSALIESGLAMLLLGRSHPASGAEHHLSHYWEMEYIRLGRRQLLHGAKVGVASAEIRRLYGRIADEGPAPWRLASADASTEQGQPSPYDAIAANWPAIEADIRSIPDEEQLREWLGAVGGPRTAEELSVDGELLRRSLREAHLVRPERYTLLRAYNERA